MNHGVSQNFELVELKGTAVQKAIGHVLEETVTLDIGRKAVFAVVVSPLRMRLFETIRRSEQCSVRELSVHSGLSATGLYYHLQALEHLDLIRQIGVRKGDARRAPALFAATCARIRIAFNPEDSTHRTRMAAVRKRWTDESIDSADASIELLRDGRALHVQSRLEWEHLTPAEIKRIGALFAQVEDVCAAARARGTRVPEDARPVHVGTIVCELADPALPCPQVLHDPCRRSGAFSEAARRMDQARDIKHRASV